VGVGLAGLVAEFLEQAYGLLKVFVGLVVSPKPIPRLAETAVRVGLSVPVRAMLRSD
jgi:hypothetical protein